MSPCLRRRPLSAQELTEKRSTWPTDFWKTHTRMHTHSYNLCRVHMLHCTQKHKHSHSSKLANTQDTLWCFDLSVPHCMCACLVQCKACDTTNLPRSLIFENLTTLRCDLIGWFQWLGHSHLLRLSLFILLITLTPFAAAASQHPPYVVVWICSLCRILLTAQIH